MPMLLQGGPFKAPVAGFHTFSVAQYRKLIAQGFLTENDRVELLEGYLVEKMPHDPIHDGTLQLVEDAIMAIAPAGWCRRVQMVVSLPRSEPEPDFVLARGNKRSYLVNHPGAVDIGLLVEVANTTLETDRENKLSIYAQAGVLAYWIVNVVDRQVEVYEQPSGSAYNATHIFKPGDVVPLVVDGVLIGTIPVTELLA